MSESTEAIAWYHGSDTGTSSETIWSVMTGHPVRRADIPYDPSDFGRCYRLRERFPAWRARLGEVAAAYPRWAPFVGSWGKLEELWREEDPSGWTAERLYALMKERRP